MIKEEKSSFASTDAKVLADKSADKKAAAGEEKKEIEQQDTAPGLEEMAEAGLHFGHKESAVHPKMRPYIFGARNSVHIIDLEKTAEKLKEALGAIRDLVSEGKTVLFVGTKIQTKNLLKETAIECGQPYVTERWIGGLFTNFDIIKKRIDYFRDLEKKREEGELEKYTKKERADFDKEIKDLALKFGGIKSMEKLPDAVFVSDIKKDALAVKEAKMKKIKVIGITDTNVDPTVVDYPIPANDDAISSVKYILEKVKEVILKAKPKAENKE